MSQNDKPMVNIGGLWMNKSKKGEIYFSGYLNGAKLYVFKNQYKEKDTHPDYVMFVSPPDRKDNDRNDLENELENEFAEKDKNWGDKPDDTPPF